MTILGPNRSLSRPAKIAITPMERNASEEAPEMMALDQPNSAARYLKKTP
jgi:hypothetical protein